MDKAKGQGLKASEKFIYSFGTLGKEVSYGMINTYAMLFLTVFMGLNGIIVGFAFCAVRLLSAVADPVMATIVNNTKSPLGKYRPWLIVGALLNTAALVVMFLPFPEFSTGAKYAYYLAAYLVWGVTYTVVDVPLMSMIPSIADTTNER
ncbi:MAG TPA: MFS transporter [Candidatus Stercoripulliclostridium merdipullorum]|uniref:MFS transporter n=1 Tax=Candidatus Stercoripulliclostridium merdipullorum TaxID=2840952 RepID=A0A9D1NB70_9FIRM|nr:MFS transporter [Candidatus Stercoripulliclostridium merdipullorum]